MTATVITSPHIQLPADSPVLPLGIDGERYVYLTPRERVRRLRLEDHQRLTILGLFEDRADFLYLHFPRKSAAAICGWDPAAAAGALIAACAAKGRVEVTP
ncbi:MAG: hypothetical protein H7Y60_09145 [Rhodospirillaceae bacterium]|nr:hypothetical protein [Rhodospirillales bacterium]